MDNLTDLDLYSALVATAVPWLAALLNRSEWRPATKWTVFALVCVVAAAGTTWLSGDLRLERAAFVRSVLIIATLASLYYRAWKPAITEVERRTG